MNTILKKNGFELYKNVARRVLDEGEKEESATFDCFSKKDNTFSLTFSMSNPRIDIMKILDFTFLKLIYQLNMDLIEHLDFQICDADNATCFLLLKPIFEDMGLPQRYSNVKIQRHVDGDKTIFVSESEGPVLNNQGAELVPLRKMTCVAKCENNGVQFNMDFEFDQEHVIPKFAEKMVGTLLYKVFKRVKDFVESV